jgi:hypothetical protein
MSLGEILFFLLRRVDALEEFIVQFFADEFNPILHA